MPDIEIKFGSIYWIPKRFSGLKTGHWSVVLGIDKERNELIRQNFNSGIYKVFPNFGSFTNIFCKTCSIHPNIENFKRYIERKSQYVDIDTVVFLNFHKYKKYFNFLEKETFFSVEKYESDNYYDFLIRVQKKDYLFQGNLFKNNAQSVVIAAKSTAKIDGYTCNCIVESYKKVGY